MVRPYLPLCVTLSHELDLSMHTSFFNYSVTRPYPYRFFTPVAIVGGAILLVLLSVMNFVQNSYVLIVQYVDNPNATISKGMWYSRWPSYLTSSVRPTCQPAILPIDTQFFTNQSGLMWTVTNIFGENSDAETMPSLPYLNNVLQNCTLQGIQMDFDASSDRSPSAAIAGPWGLEVRSFVTCNIWSPIGRVNLNLTAAYNPVQDYPVAGSTTFISRNVMHRASMYWAEALLSIRWITVMDKIVIVNLYIRPISHQMSKGYA